MKDLPSASLRQHLESVPRDELAPGNVQVRQVWAPRGQGVQGGVRHQRAAAQVQVLQLVAVEAEALRRPVGDALAVLQDERFDVVAQLGEGGQRLVSDLLATAQAQLAQKAATSEGSNETSTFAKRVVRCQINYHLLAKFSTTTVSMSVWKLKRSTRCQFDPSRARMFHDLDTWAHLQREMTSRWEKIRRRSSLGRRRLMRASSFSLKTRAIFQPLLLLPAADEELALPLE